MADQFEDIILMQPPSKLRIVLDTNQVLQDIWYSSRKNTKTALQDALQRVEYWAFMAEPIFQEVERKLRELARGDVEKQIALWRSVCVPHIKRVRLKRDAYHDDPIIQEMNDPTMGDPTDVPTAQLYLFLYPDFLFSEDNHLRAFPRSQMIGQISAAYRDIIEIQHEMRAVGFFPLAGIAITSELWGAFRRLPPIVQVILGGAAIGALLFFGPSVFQKVSAILKDPETGRILDMVGNRILSRVSQLQKASMYLQEQSLPPLLPMSVSDHLIEILTIIDEPLSLDLIFYYLIARGYQPKGTNAGSKRYVLSVLKRLAVFSDSSWQLVEAHSQEMRSLVESFSG
jgi:hypothetical protein